MQYDRNRKIFHREYQVNISQYVVLEHLHYLYISIHSSYFYILTKQILVVNRLAEKDL